MFHELVLNIQEDHGCLFIYLKAYIFPLRIRGRFSGEQASLIVPHSTGRAAQKFRGEKHRKVFRYNSVIYIHIF